MKGTEWCSTRTCKLHRIVLVLSFVILLSFYLFYSNREYVQYMFAQDKGSQILVFTSDRRNQSIILGTGTYNLEDPNGTRKGTNSWSQYGQDLYLDGLFNKKRHGFFVEIGGFDGETISNTLFFERWRGWQGLLVEANPYVFDIMLKKDRNCYMMNACISKNLSNMNIVLAGAYTSANETLTESHRKKIHAEVRIKNGETFKVMCFPLKSVLHGLRRTRIDYFSLDVEGAELHILESIDWDKVYIDVFTIETVEHRNEILIFMKNHRYEWIKQIIYDDVFRKIN